MVGDYYISKREETNNSGESFYKLYINVDGKYDVYGVYDDGPIRVWKISKFDSENYIKYLRNNESISSLDYPSSEICREFIRITFR